MLLLQPRLRLVCPARRTGNGRLRAGMAAAGRRHGVEKGSTTSRPPKSIRAGSEWTPRRANEVEVCWQNEVICLHSWRLTAKSKVLLEDLRASDSLGSGNLCTQAQHQSAGNDFDEATMMRVGVGKCESVDSVEGNANGRRRIPKLFRSIRRMCPSERRFQIHDPGTGLPVGRSCNRAAASP